MNKGCIIGWFVWICTAAVAAQAAILQEPLVTDVTPRSFSVVWVSSEPADPSLKVLNAASQDITEAVSQTPFPGLQTSAELSGAARSAGMLKVRVAGLTPDTLYSFQTRTEVAGDVLTFPADAPIAVRTQIAAEVVTAAGDRSPNGNDLLKFQVFKPGGVYAARGSLLVASVPGAGHPVSAYVGDGSNGGGSEPGLVIIDLNNFYDAQTHRSLSMDEPAVLTLRALRGNGVQGDALLHYRLLDARSGQLSVITPRKGYPADFNCDGAVNLLDATLMTGSWGLQIGDAAFNADYDLDADGDADMDDSRSFQAEYGNKEPFDQQ